MTDYDEVTCPCCGGDTVNDVVRKTNNSNDTFTALSELHQAGCMDVSCNEDKLPWIITSISTHATDLAIEYLAVLERAKEVLEGQR